MSTRPDSLLPGSRPDPGPASERSRDHEGALADEVRPAVGSGRGRPARSGEGADESLAGRRIHKYELLRVIGRGGMGTVYEAVNTAIGKRVAMKFLDGEALQQGDSIVRFQREAQAASAIDSPHIVEIFDAGTSDDGLPFIVMELLRGEDLGHRIRRTGRLELDEALNITAQILRGLRCAHDAGIVHRDLKPDNIFLVEREDDPCVAKILDFGISKVVRTGAPSLHTLTRKGTVLGTPFYMSPEQAQAQPDVDGRADLWSLGAILFEALTGRPPYVGTTYEQVIVNICMYDAPDVRRDNPTVPEAIADVIAQALERDRDARFADAQSFLSALRAAAPLVSSHPTYLLSDEPRARVPSGRLDSPARAPIPGLAPQTAPVGPLDDTLEVRSAPMRSPRSARRAVSKGRRRVAERRVGWVTMGLVAGGALVVGGGVAFLLSGATKRPPEAHTDAWIASSAPTAPAFQAPSAAIAADAVDRAASVAVPAPLAPATLLVAATSAPEGTEPRKPATKLPHVPVSPATATAPSKLAAHPVEAPPTAGVAPGLHLKTD